MHLKTYGGSAIQSTSKEERAKIYHVFGLLITKQYAMAD
jgi:hypothetical protein